ncbi:MAG TPA: hypothetical protein VF883_11630 [Thermoanaerobaculia bacterium]
MQRAIFLGAAIVVALLHLTSIPRTIWEYDESLFCMAVENYDPLNHFPPPPGYPIYIAVAKLAAPLFGYVPFRTLTGLSAFTAVAGFILLGFAFRKLMGDTRAGALGAFLFYTSPAMLLHATLPQSDSGALALLAASIWLCAKCLTEVPRSSSEFLGSSADPPEELRGTRGTPRNANAWIAFAALACAVTVGWRLQFAIAVVPLFGMTVLLLRSWRERFIAVQWFAIACAAWLIALISVTGSIEMFWKWMSGQAAYFAQHDADISRTGRSTAQIVLRFVSHPWGPKWLALPVLALAALGLFDATKRRLRVVLPVIAMSVVYFAFALAMMDPADGVRYALPALPGVAFLAALGIAFLRRVTKDVFVDWAVLALYAFGAYAYTGPLLRQRTQSDAPPFAAIKYLRSVAPRNAVILYDMPLKPHSQYLLRGYTRLKVDEGLLRFGHRTDVPLYELTDSATQAPDGKVFRWNTPDAYTKLTRGHYGAASVVPLPVTQRFLAIEGISPPERTRTGSWRWIGARGILSLPDLGARSVRLTFEVPLDYPLASNRATIAVDGGQSVTAEVTKGRKTVVDVALPPGRATLRITPEQTFVPANVPGRLSRDRRTLSIMLTGLEQAVPRAAAPAATPRAGSRRAAG